jgi:hypothetical protein
MFSDGPCREVILVVRKIAGQRVHFSSDCLFGWCMEIQSGVRLFCKVVVVEELVENCCG